MTDIFVSKDLPPASALKSSTKHPVGLFTSFCINPQGVSFHDQDPNEQILLFLRKHFATNIPWLFFSFMLLTLPFLFPFVSVFLPLPSSITSSIFLYILFYYLLVLTYIFIKFITWFYTVSMVTNKRVVDIDYSDLVYHNVAATKLTQLEDVDYTQLGFLRSLFNYGDVFVQTAGEKPNFDFLAVPQPARVARIVVELIGAT